MKRPTSFSTGRRGARGFTLIEMMITLVVFVLLAAMIYSIVLGVLKSSSILRDSQNRTDETTALQEFLKRELTQLPQAGVFTSYRRGTGEGLSQNGIIFGPAGSLTAVDTKIQANGLYTVRLARSGSDAPQTVTVFGQAVSADDAGLNWTPLIRDVRSVAWKFLGFHDTHWTDAWTGGSRPDVVELSLQIGGDLRPRVIDFWLPPLTAPPAYSTLSSNG